MLGKFPPQSAPPTEVRNGTVIPDVDTADLW